MGRFVGSPRLMFGLCPISCFSRHRAILLNTPHVRPNVLCHIFTGSAAITSPAR